MCNLFTGKFSRIDSCILPWAFITIQLEGPFVQANSQKENPMSKPIARVVFAVLISLVIIAAAASPIAQSSFGNVLRTAGVYTTTIISVPADNQNLRQGTMNKQIPASSQYNDFAPDSSHDCNSDPSLDY